MSIATLDCPACGFVHLDPLPTPARLDELAQALYSSLRPEYARHQSEDMPWHRVIWVDLLRRLRRRAPEATLLDVGSGLGSFVQVAEEEGWSAAGLNPSADAVRHAREKGLHTIPGTIETLDHGSYGAITMFNVLEHLISPEDALHRCHERLAENGVLYVSVPNDFNWMQRRLESRYGPWWVHPLHASYFRPRTLRALAERAGFEVLWASTSFPMEAFALLGFPYPRKARLGRRLHRLRTRLDRAGLHRLYPLLARAGMGRHVNLLLQRTERAPAPIPRCPARVAALEGPAERTPEVAVVA